MIRGGSSSFLACVVLGIALGAVPFLFPRISPAFAAILFDGGSLVVLVSLVLLLVEVRTAIKDRGS